MTVNRPRAPGSRTLAALGLGALLAGALYGLGPGTATASSHREAPLVAADPAIDNTDVYAFVSPDRPGYVTFVANWQPFEEPNGGPNFYPFATDATYHIKVDNDGDAKPDAEFRWKFKNIDKRGNDTFLYNNGPVTSIDDENLLFRQTYTLESSFNGGDFTTRVEDAPVAPSRVGPASMPDYKTLRDQATTTLPGGWKLFAGQADDPFFLDLRVFDLLYGGDLSETGQDTVAGYNVNTIAIQVPFKDVALNADATRNPVIGVWSTTERNRVRITGGGQSGGKVQVSRLGQPLVNEVIVPAGLKDAFNASKPRQDAQTPALVKRVLEPEVPKLIEQIYGIPAPQTPRNDLSEIFLTGITTKAGGPIKADLNSQLNNKDVRASAFVPAEELRLNLSVPVADKPNRLGVLGGDLQGFPNGRRLTDDVVDIELQALVGAAQTGKIVDALAAGDRVNANDQQFSGQFPYLALPNGVAVNSAGKRGGAQPAPSSSAQKLSGGTAPAAAPAAARPMVPVAYATGASGLGILIVLGGLVVLLRWRRGRVTRADDDPTLRF
ncbi:hypothetical protein GCM10010168_77600 [Actinoplanes ianthinogenes]|uniref:DUF4331 domain-containing protein n=1 Tax=Actinoplanes ianthinogenes TaxID=122358 RepID=A0ABM7M9G7_9ACTN|nr:DUF4331 domain-containing protein [Actinoplanes ianthinogenes]BCJ48314.1 hypothetical protein Aiant_89710 [Actinoplanes ianthinogenes]GGR47209.1 hypothetical protein GCM10010168_77600 [Actinoplanes ianthinogenes]